MNCPNCHQETEAGALYCGNCGQPLKAGMPLTSNVAAYALATSIQHKGETQAVLAVVLGSIGAAGSAFMPLAGLALGLAGVVTGTVARTGHRRGLSLAGIIISSLALLAGLGSWTYNLNHEAASKAKAAAANNGPTVMANNLSTPCYSLSFTDKLNISNDVRSCDMRAFNGAAMETSTDAYKVYANESALTSAGPFTALAKSALEKDIQTNLSGFGIDSERVGSFAGSPAYLVMATNKSQGVTVAEAAVYHKTASGNNVFILVHATAGGPANFKDLESQWQWK